MDIKTITITPTRNKGPRNISTLTEWQSKTGRDVEDVDQVIHELKGEIGGEGRKERTNQRKDSNHNTFY